MAGGRPTKYRVLFVTQAQKLCRLGATDKELADFFQITESTLNKWKNDHTKFSEAIKLGKEFADAEVADKLFQRATGYSCPDVDVKVIGRKIVKTKLIKHYPPDTAAMIFWLKNRQKHKWRDKIEHGLTDENGKDVNPVYVFKLPDNGRNSEEAGG